LDAVEGDLAANEEDKEGYGRPEDFFTKGDLDYLHSETEDRGGFRSFASKK
jgi:hypothetical protein